MSVSDLTDKEVLALQGILMYRGMIPFAAPKVGMRPSELRRLMASAKRKLNAKNHTHAATLAYRAGRFDKNLLSDLAFLKQEVRLSDKEVQALQLVADGSTDDEIARAGLGYRAIDSIFEELGVHSREECVLYGLHNGLIN